MAKLFVIQAGPTEWSRHNRVDSPAGVPLTSEGADLVRQAVTQMTDLGIGALFASANEADRQTGEIVAELLGLRLHVVEDLHELNFGLWQGLREEDIRQRFTRVYRQWIENPSTVCPPEGETLFEAAERVGRAVDRILRKHKQQNILLVLHPVAGALLRCRLLGADLATLWSHPSQPAQVCSYDLDQTHVAREMP